MRIFSGRKAGFLASTARVGLHGGLLKDDKGHGDGIEVGPGFAAASAPPENPGDNSGDDGGQDGGAAGGQPAAGGESGASGDDGDGGDGGGDDDAGDDDAGDDGGQDDDAGGGDSDGSSGKKDRGTSEFIRELKHERREMRRELAQLRAERAAMQNGGLPNPPAGDTSTTARTKPDPTDTAKYPLGVLDDAYQADNTAYLVQEGIREALAGERQTEKAKAAQDAAEQQLSVYREKVSDLADAGSDLHDDYEEVVLEAGLRGDYQLTETTFVAASEAANGAQILYSLATDKKEAARVAALTPFQQMKYVLDKDAEFAAKGTPRRKPQAGAPPGNTPPAGRNPSRTIRGDTDNLDDFRKLWYKK